MPSAKIFLVGENESQLTEMVETPFEKEDILQVLLERYNDLLPGDQIDPEEPRRWLLVSREMGVPGTDGGSDVWSLDHLFIDQDGIPTFVECKRACDTRARREVVAQMLDYAANGTLYWSMDKLRQTASDFARDHKRDLDEEIRALGDSEEPIEPEEFWKTVEQNLRKGHVRLIFVCDHTPLELRRLVEFLNEKMSDVEVLAVEIKQFLGKNGSHKAIVPRLVGFTETARENKSKSSDDRPRHTNRQTVLSKSTPEAAKIFEHMLDKAAQLNHRIYWGVVGFSVGYKMPETGILASFFYGYPPNIIEFYLKPLDFSPEDENLLRNEIMKAGFFKRKGKRTLYAEIDVDNAPKILDKIDWIYDTVKAAVEKAS
jgi:hypothetical protein